MLAWINLVVLIVSALGCLYFYVKSVSPAALERVIGPSAYVKCTRYRVLSVAFMALASAGYIAYFFHPLPIPLPRTFPWPWPLSALIAAAIALPAGYVWWRGLKDAGEETLIVKKEHTLHGGIYEKIRHPQALGELPYWWVFAFLLDSPFLALFSFIWIPIYAIMCWAEERDLLLRYGEAYEEYRKRTGFLIPQRRRTTWYHS